MEPEMHAKIIRDIINAKMAVLSEGGFTPLDQPQPGGVAMTEDKPKTINSYPKVYNLGHKNIKGILDDPVVVQEKIDGSQFSMMMLGGELFCRSKGKEIDINNPNNMFKLAVDTAINLAPELTDGWVYRCEYLSRPKHNALAYERVPKHNLIVYDICIGVGTEDYLTSYALIKECERIGLESVPVFAEGVFSDLEVLKSFLNRKSVLGDDVDIEGIAIKNYHKFDRGGKAMFGKIVSEKFKEKHRSDQSDRHVPIETRIVEEYKTEARWQKALQHLTEEGKLEGTPRDIGTIIKEIQRDVWEEDGEEIATRLTQHYRQNINRGIVRGVPEWYKDILARKEFSEDG